MSFTLTFNFTYRDKVHFAIIEYQNYSGPLPRTGELLFFGGAERALLESKKLIYAVWIVESLAYDYADQQLVRITINLRHKGQKPAGIRRDARSFPK